MGHLFAQALWLSLPVIVTGILHMFVVKANRFPRLNLPLDRGATFRGHRIFGDNKTWRGVVVMVAGAALLGMVQGLLGGPWAARSHVACLDFGSYGGDGVLAFAAGYGIVNAVLGLGYVLGELPNSFAKRQLDITPGKTGADALGKIFFIVDQADSVIAAFGLGLLVFQFGWPVFWAGVFFLTALHLAINAALYFGKVRRNL